MAGGAKRQEHFGALCRLGGMRQINRLLRFLLLLAVAAPMSACLSSSPSPLAGTDYISMAMQSSRGESWGLGIFPKKIGAQKCVVHVGAPGVWIPSTCATSLTVRSGEEATVRFVQRWNARDFFAGSPKRRHLKHTWELTVSPQAPGDHVVQSRHYGDFPPQLTRSSPYMVSSDS
jgi:hypothetical protein